MAGGIDTSDRKPRRMRGTPALKVINKYSAIALTVSIGIGLLIYKLPNSTRFMNTYFSEEEMERDRKQREAHAFMLSNQMIGQKSSSEIRQVLRHKQKYETEK